MARAGYALPSPDEVEQLYALASSLPPSSGDTDVAATYAALYDLALDRADLAAVTAREVGELIGVCCGHRWNWAEQTDEWSQDLAERLGDDAAQLEGSFAVQLLAVHPSFGRQGLGFELLKRLMIASAASVHWLLTPDADTSARRLFRRMGYRPLTVGPEAPNGEPGVVLVHG
mgnify:FL=1